MLKSIANLEIKKENGVYTLLIPLNANIGELHDVLHEMKDFVINKILEVQKAAKEVKKESPKDPESVIETTEV
jgi:diadenosine tetraphosphate (Ap4A) HIT family hydrolase